MGLELITRTPRNCFCGVYPISSWQDAGLLGPPLCLVLNAQWGTLQERPCVGQPSYPVLNALYPVFPAPKPAIPLGGSRFSDSDLEPQAAP